MVPAATFRIVIGEAVPMAVMGVPVVGVAVAVKEVTAGLHPPTATHPSVKVTWILVAVGVVMIFAGAKGGLAFRAALAVAAGTVVETVAGTPLPAVV